VPFLDRTLARALRPYVASMVAYAVTLDSPRLHRGLPTTGLTFVLPVGEPLDVGWAGQALTRQKRWSCVSGLHTQPAEIFCGVADRGIQLSLTTLGARALLGLPAAALAAEILSLDDVAPWLAQLPERLAEVHGWPQRLAVAEQELLAALARHGDPVVRPEIGAALARLVDGGGVQEVADEVGYSRRHLGNLVREECGVGPKVFQRLARFERVRPALVTAAHRGRPIAAVAAACGYADQAHLAREWNELAGCPPSTWLAEEFPNLQVAEGAAEAR